MDISEVTQPATSNQLVRDVVLSPIGGGGLVGQTVRRLSEAISLGIFTAGERLPVEVELAEQLGISAMTLRQALAVMREAGYLETHRGRTGGTYVTKDALEVANRRAQQTLDHSVEYYQDLTDFRIAVGGEAASLAAQRASADDLAELNRLVEAMDVALSFLEFRKLDAAFHLAIASSTGSSRLVRAESEIQSELNPLLGSLALGSHTIRASNDEHRAILAAIKKGTPQRARERATAHMTSSLEALIGFLEVGLAGQG